MILKHFRYAALGLGLLLGALDVVADTPEGFYDPELVRGFVSIKGDFRQMRSAGVDNLNSMLFDLQWGKPRNASMTAAASELDDYHRFEDSYLGLHAEIGAEYKQFMTWFDIDFMPTQVSEKPASQTSFGYPLYDASWNTYGANWMFGWKLLPESSPINLIPSVGLGVSLLNVHLASLYYLIDEKDTTKVTALRNRTYSTLGYTCNSELEARVHLGQLSLGAYGGYKFARYDQFSMEGYGVGEDGMEGDTWFVGGKVTWTMQSAWERKQREKL